MPPARLTAAATFSDGGVKKTKIGYWMPNRSQSSVCISWQLPRAWRGPRRPGGVRSGPWPTCSPAYRPASALPRRRSRGCAAPCNRQSPCARTCPGQQRGPGALAGSDDRGDMVAEAGIGHTDHQGVEHVGMALERGLDLFGGVDLLAAAVNRHRAAAQHDHGAVRLDLGVVAGNRVAHAVVGLEGLGGLLLVLVVADRDVALLRDHAADPRNLV